MEGYALLLNNDTRTVHTAVPVPWTPVKKTLRHKTVSGRAAKHWIFIIMILLHACQATVAFGTFKTVINGNSFSLLTSPHIEYRTGWPPVEL